MHTDESIVKSFGGDALKADREIKRYQSAWQKGDMVGNLPQSVLLEIAIRNPKEDKAPCFGETPKAKIVSKTPHARKAKVTKELATADG
jgi:hypothetical protein